MDGAAVSGRNAASYSDGPPAKRGMSKLRELLRRQRQESEVIIIKFLITFISRFYAIFYYVGAVFLQHFVLVFCFYVDKISDIVMSAIF